MDAQRNDLKGITEQVEHLRRRVERPWWRSMPNLVAALAFALSLVTAVLAAISQHFKDIHDRQAELSAVVEKLADFPTRSYELYDRYKDNPAIAISDIIINQKSMLANQGFSLAQKLGSDAPASELYVVGNNLMALENYEAGKKVFAIALDSADNFYDEAAVLCSLGYWRIVTGNSRQEQEDGNQLFERVNKIGLKYANVGNNPPELAYTIAFNETQWAYAWAMRDCAAAGPHLREAAKQVVLALQIPAVLDVRARIDALTAQLATCGAGQHLLTPPTPAPPASRINPPIAQ